MYKGEPKTCKNLYTYNQERTKNSERTGYRPCIIFPSGAKYIGNWYKNEKNSYGVLQRKDGYFYIGDWNGNNRHGFGTLGRKYPDGHRVKIYIGQWQNHERNGDGKQYYENGTYFGQWKDNRRCGHGIMWFADGTLYFGNWKDDRFHDIGVYHFKNGNRYEGSFCKGMQHGEGLYYHSSTGQLQKGEWLKSSCTNSIMVDAFRNQAKNPTWYPITRLWVAEINDALDKYAEEYFPSMWMYEHNLSRLCTEISQES